MSEDVQMDWDLEPFFDTFDGEEMRSFKIQVREDTEALYRKAQQLDALDAANQDAWASVLLEYEDLESRLHHFASYLSCLTAADARNEAYTAEAAALNLMFAEGAKLDVELLRALRDATDQSFESLVSRKDLSGATYLLEKMRTQAQRTMDPALEVLAADLGVNGIEAWGALYDNVSGKLEFEMVHPDGRTEVLPISQRRSLMEHADPLIRKAAFEGGNASWARMETVTAGALNAISGTRLTLNSRRGVDHFLDSALHQANISRDTLNAMFQAIYEEIELPRDILRFKARAMGTPDLAWYDLAAALELPDQEEIDWDRGSTLVKESFAGAYPELGEFLKHTYDSQWIDHRPRPGKRPGAFCTGSPIIKQSRVYMTYNDTMGDVLTLAHEIGHAYHSYVMNDLRPLARSYPMTLAESASTFGEMLLMKGLLDDPTFPDTTKAFLLNLETSHAATYLMDIPVRFEFEKTMHEERGNGEIAVSRFREMMVQSQRDVFGDVLRVGGEDPYFWASKLHFYITGVTFYNFPYTFGYLLSRGLFALYQSEGRAFLPRYEEFLRMTGSDSAENVVKKSIGRDISDPSFWREAIRSLQEPQDRLEAILPGIIDMRDPAPGNG